MRQGLWGYYSTIVRIFQGGVAGAFLSPLGNQPAPARISAATTTVVTRLVAWASVPKETGAVSIAVAHLCPVTARVVNRPIRLHIV